MAKPSIKASPLMSAIRARDLIAVVAALDAGADVNETDIHGHPGLPLRTACFDGNVFIVRELLRRGADVNAPGGEGSGMPIRLAVRARQKEIVDLLLDFGAEIPFGLQIDPNKPLIAELDFPDTAQKASPPPPPSRPEPSPGKLPGTLPGTLPPDCPVIEKLEIQGAYYGVDTNILNQDLLRLEEGPAPGNSRRDRDV